MGLWESAQQFSTYPSAHDGTVAGERTLRGWTEFTAAKLHYRVRLFASDAQEGLKEARKTVFPAVPWQRCHAHLQRNAQRYVPRQLLRDEVAADIRAIFNAPERADADALLQRLLVIRA